MKRKLLSSNWPPFTPSLFPPYDSFQHLRLLCWISVALPGGRLILLPWNVHRLTVSWVPESSRAVDSHRHKRAARSIHITNRYEHEAPEKREACSSNTPHFFPPCPTSKTPCTKLAIPTDTVYLKSSVVPNTCNRKVTEVLPATSIMLQPFSPCSWLLELTKSCKLLDVRILDLSRQRRRVAETCIQ